MSDALKTIQRIRKAQEDAARQNLARAETARDVSAAVLNATTEALDSAQMGVDRTNVALLAQTHAYVLRLEMNRRALARETALRDAIVEDRQDKLREAAVETKSIENVVEARDEQLAREVALKQQSQLDEFGSVGWWRNSA